MRHFSGSLTESSFKLTNAVCPMLPGGFWTSQLHINAGHTSMMSGQSRRRSPRTKENSPHPSETPVLSLTGDIVSRVRFLDISLEHHTMAQHLLPESRRRKIDVK